MWEMWDRTHLELKKILQGLGEDVGKDAVGTS